MRDLPIRSRLYVAAVVVVGMLVLVVGIRNVAIGDLSTVLILATLFVMMNFLKSPLRRGVAVREGIDISVQMPISMASVLLLGPFGAPIVAASMALTPNTPWFKRLFNGGMAAITAWVASEAYLRVGGHPINVDFTFSPRHVLLPVIVTALVMELVNGLLMVAVIALTERVSPIRVWFGTLSESAFPMFIYSIFGLMLAVVWSYVGPISAALVLAPLMVARWVFAQFAARQEAYEATMRSLIQAVETKDAYTRGHSERVSRASVLIGRRSGMREDRVATLRYAGMLHDVGKLGVPTLVLQKAGRLSEEEFDAIQQHPSRGREITKELEFLGEAVEGIHLHHERIDGRGYPLGLKGMEIPEFARIIAVADAFDSMTTTRSYRGARSVEDAVLELRRCKGSQFDPDLVEALVEGIEVDGWDATDTMPSDLPVALPGASEIGVPSFGSDDDDPTAARQLGIGGPAGAAAIPDDASELDALMDVSGEERR
ncbi:unannotated protein [freshwater metagenome]|uniref:Unannotated protein n=1 Tax=freshwater metagenome TaxID=449393 RepID=A0A6J7QRT9_9ZZZZ